MPNKSLQRGDYSLLLAIESSSRPHSWYRVLADRQTGSLSCDCPPWTFARNLNTLGQRTCPHTAIGQRLVAGGQGNTPPPFHTPNAQTPLSMLLEATHTQWPGLRGEWSLETQAHAQVNNHPYTFVLLRLALGNGGTATGVAAFAEQHGTEPERMVAGVAGWCGYAIAAEVARLGGYPMVGQPPEHFTPKPASRRSTRPSRSTPAEVPSLVLPPLAMTDILKIGDEAILRDGLLPAQRAENTLRLFLGEQVYTQLEQQGFLDVSSVHYAREQRVYRLRRDPDKRQERRVRLFEHGRYVRDYCLVRGQDVPEADHFLTVWLGLLSDEMETLSVVGRHNIFAPLSDGFEQEVLPARWQARSSQPVC